MGQVSLYFTDELEEKIKKEAASLNKSTSAYISALVKKELEKKTRPISKKFLALAGTYPDFPLMEDDLPPKQIPRFSEKKHSTEFQISMSKCGKFIKKVEEGPASVSPRSNSSPCAKHNPQVDRCRSH